VLRIGPELVFGRFWKESGIQEVVQSLLEARAERWREDYLIPETQALDLHHLYLRTPIRPGGQTPPSAAAERASGKASFVRYGPAKPRRSVGSVACERRGSSCNSCGKLK
jgi:hypothetical protein